MLPEEPGSGRPHASAISLPALSGRPALQNQVVIPVPPGRSFFSTHNAGKSWSLTRMKHLQLGNATVGTAEPPAKLAIDVLHHDHIRVNVRLVVSVEISGRELVQLGWTLRDDGSRSILHFDEGHFAEKIARPERRHANDAPRLPELVHHE